MVRNPDKAYSRTVPTLDDEQQRRQFRTRNPNHGNFGCYRDAEELGVDEDELNDVQDDEDGFD